MTHSCCLKSWTEFQHMTHSPSCLLFFLMSCQTKYREFDLGGGTSQLHQKMKVQLKFCLTLLPFFPMCATFCYFYNLFLTKQLHEFAHFWIRNEWSEWPHWTSPQLFRNLPVTLQILHSCFIQVLTHSKIANRYVQFSVSPKKTSMSITTHCCTLLSWERTWYENFLNSCHCFISYGNSITRPLHTCCWRVTLTQMYSYVSNTELSAHR